jgi:hypothetical protein
MLSTFLLAAVAATAPVAAPPTPAPTADMAAPVTVPTAPPAADPAIAIPAGTRLVLELVAPVSSKTATPGEPIAFRLRQPLLLGDRVLMPAGATAGGLVIHAQKAGAYGKAGELLLAVRYVEANGVRIALRALEPIRGTDRSRTVTAVSAGLSVVPYAGLLVGFVHGGQINVPAGTPFVAKVAKPVPFAGIDLASLPMAPAETTAEPDVAVPDAAAAAAPTATPAPAPVAAPADDGTAQP